MFKNQSTAQFAAKVEAELKKGNTTITVLDTDNENWTSGYAEYLMYTYKVINIEGGFTADINSKKKIK